MQNDFPKRLRLPAFALLSTIFAMAAISCGGGGSTPPPPPPPPGTTSSQIRVGDASTDRVMAFQATLGSPIIANPVGSGASIQIPVGTNRLELSHLAGKLEPVGIANVTPGTYASMTVNILNPVVSYVNGTGSLVTLLGFSQSVTVNFNPALTVGSSPTILNIDFNLANALSTDASGNVLGINFTSSSLVISTNSVAAENLQEDNTGELEEIVGQVAGISGSNFTLTATQGGSQLVFTTDNTTQFSGGLTNLASLNGKIVRVEGVTKADGTLFARRVEGMENQTGSSLEGTITLLLGTPATFLTMVSDDGTGSGMDTTKVGAPFNVSMSGLTTSNFGINQGNVDFSGLGVPSASFPFDATTMQVGQRIEVESAGSVPATNGTITADKVRLEQQAITGVVSNFTAGTGGAARFDVTVPNTSFLATASGQTVVHVFQQPGTNNKFGTISNTKTVRVRGLLFWTGTTFNMIARRITP